MLLSQATAYSFMFGPSSRSTTSLIPNQFTIAATFSSSFPGHSRSSPADAGSIPVVSDKWPPAEWPVTTSLLVSKLYCLAFRITQRNAQRQSSTAAGASDTRARRYSTLTTDQPASRYGTNWSHEVSFAPPAHPPPCM